MWRRNARRPDRRAASAPRRGAAPARPLCRIRQPSGRGAGPRISRTSRRISCAPSAPASSTGVSLKQSPMRADGKMPLVESRSPLPNPGRTHERSHKSLPSSQGRVHISGDLRTPEFVESTRPRAEMFAAFARRNGHHPSRRGWAPTLRPRPWHKRRPAPCGGGSTTGVFGVVVVPFCWLTVGPCVGVA